MTSRKFTVSGFLPTEVGSWFISTEVEAKGSTLPQLRQSLNNAIMGLHQMGVRTIPGKVVGQADNPAMVTQAGMMPGEDKGIPNCPVHGQPMAESKYKRKDGWQGYICTKNDAGVYCNHQAAVDPQTGEIKRWEKKAK